MPLIDKWQQRDNFLNQTMPGCPARDSLSDVRSGILVFLARIKGFTEVIGPQTDSIRG
jgi:hypothetical protein